MLEDKDIQKLVSLLSTKEDVNQIRSDITDMREILQSLMVSTDKIAKSLEILATEYSAVSKQLTRHEKWIQQLSEKVGIKLIYE